MRNATLLTAAMVVFTAVSGFAGGIRIGDTPAGRIAKDASIPGKGKAGKCLPFAVALQHKLEAAGIPSRVIVYGYEAGGVPAVGTDGEISAEPVLGTEAGRGSHAVVVYEDDGRIYVMDNQSWTPRWVRNAGPVQMAQQFSGIHCSVKMARVLDEGGSLKMTTLPTRRVAAN